MKNRKAKRLMRPPRIVHTKDRNQLQLIIKIVNLNTIHPIGKVQANQKILQLTKLFLEMNKALLQYSHQTLLQSKKSGSFTTVSRKSLKLLKFCDNLRCGGRRENNSSSNVNLASIRRIKKKSTMNIWSATNRKFSASCVIELYWR